MDITKPKSIYISISKATRCEIKFLAALYSILSMKDVSEIRSVIKIQITHHCNAFDGMIKPTLRSILHE